MFRKLMNQPLPPKWPIWILNRICSYHQLEILYGDVIEIFQKRARKGGLVKAKILFIIDAFSLIRPFAMKRPNKSKTAINLSTLFNLKLSLRNVYRNKLFAGINFLGLGVGFYTSLMIAQYTMFEMGFDKFHSNYENTFSAGPIRP